MVADDEASESGRELTARDAVADRFKDQADLTAIVVNDAVFRGASAQQALFSGSLFRNCTFYDCNFRRSDFEGAVFESCSFQDCDFSVADFRSVDLVRSSFIRCSFEEGSIRSCHFTACRLDQCSITGHSFGENRLEDTVIESCSFLRSTLLHCEFTRTTFKATDLSDCTSQYHLFDDCSFEKSSLNAEAIGLTFGLNRENLQSLDLVWRGEDLARPQGGHRPEDLVTTYLARRWNFAASIVKLNFGIGSSLEALGEVFSTVRQSFSSSMPIRRDELNFLAAVIDRLSAVGQLPFLAIAAGLDVVAASSEMNDGRYALNLRGLFHSLKEAEHLALGVLEETVAPLLQADRSEEVMSVCFHFVDVPTHSFGQWLSDMHSAGLFSGPIPVFRYSAKGSYLEYFYMAPGTLAGILICLNLVERIIDKMISIRARTGVLSSKKLSPVIRRKALQPVAAVSPALLKELRFYLDFARGPRGPRMIADIQEFGQQLTNIEVDDGSA